MSRDHWILLGIALSYVAAAPFVRRMQLRDKDIDPERAFLIWLLWPLMLVVWIGLQARKIPALLFPVPQLHAVRKRLQESADRATPTEEKQ